MGRMIIQCFLGFSVAHSNSFSDHLERRCRDLELDFRRGNADFLHSLRRLHDAVDAALEADAKGAGTALADGLGLLASCNDHLSNIGEALVRTRADLFERADVDPEDPLIAREPFFGSVDYEAVYRELLAAGAALPQRAFWDDVASRLRQGGVRAGLRLLDRHLRELQSALRGYIGRVQSEQALPFGEQAAALHESSLGVAATVMGFTRLLTTFTYFSILCERASGLYEHSLSRQSLVATG